MTKAVQLLGCPCSSNPCLEWLVARASSFPSWFFSEKNELQSQQCQGLVLGPTEGTLPQCQRDDSGPVSSSPGPPCRSNAGAEAEPSWKSTPGGAVGFRKDKSCPDPGVETGEKWSYCQHDEYCHDSCRQITTIGPVNWYDSFKTGFFIILLFRVFLKTGWWQKLNSGKPTTLDQKKHRDSGTRQLQRLHETLWSTGPTGLYLPRLSS